MSIKILTGDCRETLKTLSAGSVHTCVTSPPYWGLRDYGTGTWEGGTAGCDHIMPPAGGPSTKQESSKGTRGQKYSIDCKKCGAKRIDKQIGLEATPEEYVEKMLQVFREVKRVLRDDGTLWLNLGDSYAQGTSSKTSNRRDKAQVTHVRKGIAEGLKQKDLVGIPWMMAFALRADGWFLRSDIIWHKPNPMPEAVTDRPTKSHEYIFLLSKSSSYFYDMEAIREPWKENAHDIKRAEEKHEGYEGKHAEGYNGNVKGQPVGDPSKGRNKRTVWTIPTHGFEGAHFATFPPDLIEPCILAGCPEGGSVLDPFGGAGTTALVADRHGRNAIICELNPDYAKIATERLHKDAGLFADIQIHDCVQVTHEEKGDL